MAEEGGGRGGRWQRRAVTEEGGDRGGRRRRRATRALPRRGATPGTARVQGCAARRATARRRACPMAAPGVSAPGRAHVTTAATTAGGRRRTACGAAAGGGVGERRRRVCTAGRSGTARRRRARRRMGRRHARRRRVWRQTCGRGSVRGGRGGTARRWRPRRRRRTTRLQSEAREGGMAWGWCARRRRGRVRAAVWRGQQLCASHVVWIAKAGLAAFHGGHVRGGRGGSGMRGGVACVVRAHGRAVACTRPGVVRTRWIACERCAITADS